ncbi:MAG: thiamine-phosphate kinase [Polyangiaceae bacterium]
MDEQGAITLLTQAFGSRARTLVDNGDDAVVLRAVREPVVLSVDASVEGVHFDLGRMRLADVGFRAHAAAVSDLAAMGAKPLCSLSALTLPRGFSRRSLAQLVAGQRDSATLHRCPIVGGNVARAEELTLSTTVVGTVKRPLRRDGARAGDEIWLFGDVGLSRAGLELMRATRKPALSAGARRAAQAAFLRPRARVTEARRLQGRAAALIDVSDGLLQDAGHVAAASGVKLRLDWRALQRIVTDELQEIAAAFGARALEWALGGGEDYALLATGPQRHRPRGAKVIGSVERGRGVSIPGAPAWVRQVRGFDHLR